MQPITNKNPLDSLPPEVKTLVLNCLGVKDLKNVQLINHLWKTMAHKPLLWQQVAKNLNIKLIDPKNAEAEVLGRVHIYEVFKGCLSPDDVERATKGCNYTQMYGAVLKYLRSGKFETSHPFLNFVHEVSRNPTKEGLVAAKQMIQDNVLYDVNLLRAGFYLSLGGTSMTLPYSALKANMEIFTSIIDKIKESPSGSDLLDSFFYELVSLGPNFKPFLEVLLRAGAKPTEATFQIAFNKGTADLVIDFCDEALRKRIIDDLTEDSDSFFEDEEPLTPDNKNSAMIKMVSEAPPATFGKK